MKIVFINHSLATSFKQTQKFVIVPKLIALPLIALEEENLKSTLTD